MSRVAFALLLGVALAGCKPAPAPKPEPAAPIMVGSGAADAPLGEAPAPTSAPADGEFMATLRIDPEPGAKAFQGVWLEREDGSRYLISYRADGVWRAFENQKVQVRGAFEEQDPRAQQMAAAHYRVDRMRIIESDTLVVDPIEVRAEQRLSGRIEEHTHPAGSKLAGTKFLQFHSDDGGSYLLANQLDDMPIGKPVKLRARGITRSPMVAHVGGRYLWLLAIE